MSYTPKRGKPLSYWLVLSLLVLLPNTMLAEEKKSAIFTVAELEALGVSTVEESIDMMQSIARKQSGLKRATLSSNKLDVSEQQAILESLNLNDIEKVEISRDGSEIKYHVSKSLKKDGLTALYTFTIIDESLKESKLDPIVTTATKSPIKSSELGDVVRVIHGDELEALGVNTVEEALNIVGNVSISNAGGQKSLFLRGSHSGATKVLYDGVNLKDVSGINGAALFELIPINSVERIEIVSGSSSILEGNGSLTGVINIISNKSIDNSFIDSIFSDGQQKVSIKTGTKVMNTSLFALVNQFNNNSLSVKSDNDEKDQFLKQSATVGFKNNTYLKGTLSGTVSFINESQELDGFNDDSKSNVRLISLAYNSQMFDNVSSGVELTQTRIEREFYNEGAFSSLYEGELSALDVYTNVTLKEGLSLVIGGEIEKESAETTFFEKQRQSTVATYSQLKWLNPILSMELGARANKYSKSKLNKVYNASVFKMIPVIDSRLKYTVKTGFRAPTLYEQYTAFFEPRAGVLSPEKSKTQEISLSKNINKHLNLNVTYFDSSMINAIDYNETGGHYINVANYDQDGLEYSATYRSNKLLEFLRAEYTNFNSKKNGSRQLKVPDYKFVLSSGFRYEKTLLGVFFIREGRKLDVQSTTIPAYHFLDLSLTYDYNLSSQIYTKVHNLFDRDYETTAGFSTSGRTLFLGFKRFF